MHHTGKIFEKLIDILVYDDLYNLRWENLSKLLKANGIKDATLYNSRGEVEFTMGSPQA